MPILRERDRLESFLSRHRLQKAYDILAVKANYPSRYKETKMLRHVPPILVLLAVLLLLTGCATAAPEPVPPSSPTPTPIPTAGLTPTLMPNTDPTPITVPTTTPTSAPASAEEPCNLMDTPFDALMLGTGQLTGLKAEFRYSGSDEHMLTTQSDPEGVLFGKGEQIFKDDTFYERGSAPDNPKVYGEWRVHPHVRQLFTRPPCLDPSSVKVGASGSSDEPHFVSERFLSEEEGAMRQEYWADFAGRPIRGRRTFFPPEYDGVSNTETGVLEYTYSGYGEPNIIEAPCARAIPHEADNPGLMRDCIYLLTAKDYLGGAEVLNWSLDIPIARWDGVTMEGTPQRITRLQLPNRRLMGFMSIELRYLSALTHLDLSHNALTGEMLRGLAQWSNLQEFRLSDNSLTGTIPPALGNLAMLNTLSLSGNNFTGCIPMALRGVAINDLSALNLPYCEPSPSQG